MSVVSAVAPSSILIVDDIRENRVLLEFILEREGFHTTSAESGEEALESVASSRPSLILLDLMLPGIDGFEVTARLKRDPATAGIPVLIVSAMHDRATRLRVVDAGAADLLVKPIDRVELCRRIRELLVGGEAPA